MGIQIISSKKTDVASGRVGFISAHSTKAVTPQRSIFNPQNLTLADTKTRLISLQDLYTLIDKHGYLRASISVIGRSAVGAWWTLVEDKESKNPSELHRKRLYRFFSEPSGAWNNINDFYSMAYKIIIGTMYLKLFGQVAFHIVRDTSGAPISMDHIPAFMVPQVDSFGNFKTPAFLAYPVAGGSPVEYSDPRDIVYIINPDFAGSPMGASDLIALSDYAFPIDIYLQTLARSYLENNTRPELIYQLPETVSEENFSDFVEEVTARWRGPGNAGRTPIVVQGEFKVHKLGDLPDALPYNESRQLSRDEEFAVVGVNPPKVGLIDGVSSSGMKESRREFHETVMEPLFTVLEEGFYWQICVRTFGFRDWRFRFNSPDFLTAVERATVDMRYYQMNTLTPNEIREGRDMRARDDDAGDLYLDQLKDETSEPVEEPPEPQGSPPEGREPEPDDGEPTEPSNDPVRGDGHDERTRNLLAEAKAWRRFAKARLGSKNARKFIPDYFDPQSTDIIQAQLNTATTVADVDRVFHIVLDILGEINE